MSLESPHQLPTIRDETGFSSEQEYDSDDPQDEGDVMPASKKTPAELDQERERLKAQAELHSDRLLFESLDINAVGSITAPFFISTLLENGISVLTDPRLSSTYELLQELESKERTIDFDTFRKLIQPAKSLIGRAIRRQLVIPDWTSFAQEVTAIYQEIAKTPSGGTVASYIPDLAYANPNTFAVSFCSIDGQVLNLGPTRDEFSVQSSSKPISYLMALSEHGEEYVHRFVGREPSGRNFNELCLNSESVPHNPMINSGAIMSCSLIKPQEDQSSRFRHIMKLWNEISGNRKYVTFSNSTYLSERATADRNFCLGFMMQEQGSFNQGATSQRSKPAREWTNKSLVDNLELYFQCCSISTCTEGQSVIASTLASGGVCPFTAQECFKPEHVRHCLSLMLSCGMYDYSGEWAYKIGLPAKSGVSGCLMVVIPNVGGFSIYSPPLDEVGNTVRGIKLCEKLVEKFSFHYYDIMNGIVSSSTSKINPLQAKNLVYQNDLIRLCYCCARGDLSGIRTLLSHGADVNGRDYDLRTPLHLAASEGQLAVVKFLVSKHANLNALDRWNGTPYTDAVREKHQACAEYLFKKLKTQSSSVLSKQQQAAITNQHQFINKPKTTRAAAQSPSGPGGH